MLHVFEVFVLRLRFYSTSELVVFGVAHNVGACTLLKYSYDLYFDFVFDFCYTGPGSGSDDAGRV